MSSSEFNQNGLEYSLTCLSNTILLNLDSPGDFERRFKSFGSTASDRSLYGLVLILSQNYFLWSEAARSERTSIRTRQDI